MKIKMSYILISFILLALLALLVAGKFFLPSFDPTKQKNNYNYLTIYENKVHYYLKNDHEGKETIVFLHSFGGNIEMWDLLIPFFKEYNILAYDMPGFGKSDKKLDDYSLSVQSDFLHALLNKLNIDKVILIGSSMGASVAAWYASVHGERVKKIILMSPSGYPGSMQHNFPGNYFYRPGVLNSLGKFFTGNLIFRKLFPNSIAFQAFSVTSSYNNSFADALKKIKVPVLLLWSKADKRTPYKYSEKYLKLIKNIKLITVSDEAGHNITSYKPDFIYGEIIHFINQDF